MTNEHAAGISVAARPLRAPFCSPDTCRHVYRPDAQPAPAAAATPPAVIYAETSRVWTFRLERPSGASRGVPHRTPVAASVVYERNTPAGVIVTTRHAALGFAPTHVAVSIASARNFDPHTVFTGEFSAQLELFDDGQGPRTVTLGQRVALDASGLTRLPVAAPPMLAKAIGYAGDSRFLALYWEPAGDEAAYTDGVLTADGDWIAWLTFAEHAHVAPHLAGYDLGSSECGATHWLLLDREQSALYVGEAEEVSRFARAAALLRQVGRNRTASPDEPGDDAPGQRPADLLTADDFTLVAASTLDIGETGDRLSARGAATAELRGWLDEALNSNEATRAGVVLEGFVFQPA